MDRRPSLLNLNADGHLGAIQAAKRGKRDAISAESFVPDAKFRAPQFDYTDRELQA